MIVVVIGDTNKGAVAKFNFLLDKKKGFLLAGIFALNWDYWINVLKMDGILQFLLFISFLNGGKRLIIHIVLVYSKDSLPRFFEIQAEHYSGDYYKSHNENIYIAHIRSRMPDNLGCHY